MSSRLVLAMVKLSRKPKDVLLSSVCRSVLAFMLFLAGRAVLLDTCKYLCEEEMSGVIK